jgi:Bacterial SH3 domain
MERHIKHIGASIATVLLFGCSTAQFQRESAGSIGGNVNPEQVTITDIDKSMTMWKWDATTSTGTYNCSTSFFDTKTFCFKAKKIRAKSAAQPVEKNLEPSVVPQNMSSSSSTMVVASSKAKIRKKPSTKAAVVKNLKKEEEVQVIKQQEDWFQVELVSGDVGWCHKSVLKQAINR